MSLIPPAETPGPKPLPTNVKLLGLASLLNDTASEMLAPLMPDFLMTVLGGKEWQLGWIDGVGDSIASLLKLWSGAKSDHLGRRKSFVVAGYTVAALARPFIGLAAVPWHLFALRGIDRVGKGIRSAPRDAMIAEVSDETNRGRNFGFHRAMDHLGAAIGPLCAFIFLWFYPGGIRVLFLLTLIPAIPIVVLLAWGLREKQKAAAAEGATPLALHGFDRNFWIYLAALLVFTLGNSSDSFLLVRAKELGIPLVFHPILWIVFHIVKGGGNLITGKWVDRIGPRPLIWAGWLLYAATYLAFGLATSAWQVWGLFLLYGVFYALTEPAEKALVAALVGSDRKGLAFGWFNLTLGVGALPASVGFGWVYSAYGPLAAFSMGATFSLVAAVLLACVRMTPAKA